MTKPRILFVQRWRNGRLQDLKRKATKVLSKDTNKILTVTKYRYSVFPYQSRNHPKAIADVFPVRLDEEGNDEFCHGFPLRPEMPLDVRWPCLSIEIRRSLRYGLRNFSLILFESHLKSFFRRCSQLCELLWGWIVSLSM